MRLVKLLLSCLCAFMLSPTLCADAAGESAPPQVEFFVNQYVSHVGRETYVSLVCLTPSWVTRDNNTFELRNHRNEVLAVFRWSNPSSRMYVRFIVPESARGGNELSVWWNGMDVTAEHVYAAFSDVSLSRVSQLEPREPAVSLTIVCGGGGTRRVEEILDVLDKYDVKATFFFCGSWLEKNVDNARRIMDAGHEIGSHGYEHVRMTELTSYLRVRRVITRMNDRCEELLGVRPRLFRAPFSDTNEVVTALVRAEGMEEIQWSIDSRDWWIGYVDEPEVICRQVTGPELVSGAVIQFHLDGHGTVEVLDRAIPYYQEDCGFRVVPVGELMELSGREIPALPDIPADDR